MSKSQTLEDLKKTGVKLSQAEAQEIHTRISDIAKGIHESGELFEVVEHKEMGRANDVKATNGFTPFVDEEKYNELIGAGETAELPPVIETGDVAIVSDLPSDHIKIEDMPEGLKDKIEEKFESINEGLSHENVVKVAEKVIDKVVKVVKPKAEKAPKAKTAKPKAKA